MNFYAGWLTPDQADTAPTRCDAQTERLSLGRVVSEDTERERQQSGLCGCDVYDVLSVGCFFCPFVDGVVAQFKSDDPVSFMYLFIKGLFMLAPSAALSSHTKVLLCFRRISRYHFCEPDVKPDQQQQQPQKSIEL